MKWKILYKVFQKNYLEHKRNIILILRFLWFFTSVPWGILPSTKLVDCADNCYTSLVFSFLFFFTLEFKKLFFFSVSSVLFFVLFCSILFSFQICFPFISLFPLLYSVCVSLVLHCCSLPIIRHFLDFSI